MISREPHARPCNNYRSTGTRIPLLSVTIPTDGNVERTGIGFEFNWVKHMVLFFAKRIIATVITTIKVLLLAKNFSVFFLI